MPQRVGARAARPRRRRPAPAGARPARCSWSKVTTVAAVGEGRAARRGRPGSRGARRRRPGRRGPRRDAASTRSDCPSAMAAWCVIRASWPPPTIPTTGRPSGAGVATSTVWNVTGYERTARRAPVPGPGGPSGTIDQVAVVERVLATIPQPYRAVAIKHRELVKFAVVGGTTWVIDTVVFLGAQEHCPGDRSRSPRRSSRCWWPRSCRTCSTASGRFRTRGGRERHHEAAAVLPHQRGRRRGLHGAPGDLPVRVRPVRCRA